MSKTIKCARCNRRYRNQPDWNATFKAGRVTAVLCSDCQTPEENMEAAINEATVDYSKTQEFAGVNERFLAEAVEAPFSASDYDLTGWADHINRGLVEAHNVGANIADPEVFAYQVTRLANESAGQFIRA